MEKKVAEFGYSKWIIPQAAVVVAIGTFGLWRLIEHTPATAVGRGLLTVLAALAFLISVRHLLRVWDRVVVTDHGIVKISWLNETSIRWNEVARIKRYRPFIEEPGLRVISKSGASIVFTQHITQFHELVHCVAGRIPDEVKASTRW